MRLPNHLILDFENKSNCSRWTNLFMQKKTLYNNIFYLLLPNNIIKNEDIINKKYRYTINFNQNIEQNFYENILKFFKVDNSTTNSYIIFNLINIHFLRKERIYTKLKYSRSPAYDMVSGGSAALLAGFLGFLISEKYGFELADSGDFYYLFMYGVFASFFLKPFLTIINYKNNLYSLFSLKPIFNFYFMLFYFLINKK